MPKRKVVKHCLVCECLFICNPIDIRKECKGYITSISCRCNEHTHMSKEDKALCGVIVIKSGKE